ncbi:MAG: hypothetical protein K2P78_08585 [Gemmataceae bacterium]|nr:hypothetical protein [Gemmataceae bacterium]
MPVTSLAATYTPPVNALSNGATPNSSWPLTPSSTRTSVANPRPGPDDQLSYPVAG